LFSYVPEELILTEILSWRSGQGARELDRMDIMVLLDLIGRLIIAQTFTE
jgi:hypothetical protein